MWLDVIAEAVEAEGFWESSAESRALLPDAEFMSDDSVKKNLRQMEQSGVIRRVARGRFILGGDDG